MKATFSKLRSQVKLLHYCGFNWGQLFLISSLALCLKNLTSLSSIGLIDMDEDINIKPTGRDNIWQQNV